MAVIMRFLLIFVFSFTCVFCKTNIKSLTESMGQEVIEIGAPIKEFPQDLEEEPSAENEEDKSTAITIPPATKKEIIKKMSDPTKKVKDIDKIDGRKKAEDEATIEKELAEIYKDAPDYYKVDNAEVLNKKVNVTDIPEKPIQRAKNEFQFQPESNDPKAIARFRTSIDEISCDRKLSGTTEVPDIKKSACSQLTSDLILWIVFLSTIHI